MLPARLPVAPISPFWKDKQRHHPCVACEDHPAQKGTISARAASNIVRAEGGPATYSGIERGRAYPKPALTSPGAPRIARNKHYKFVHQQSSLLFECGVTVVNPSHANNRRYVHKHSQTRTKQLHHVGTGRTSRASSRPSKPSLSERSIRYSRYYSPRTAVKITDRAARAQQRRREGTYKESNPHLRVLKRQQ